jgi:exodeoxyribonuclease VII large subunit
MPDRALTVTQLNEYVGALLSGDPLLRGLKVQGEISGFKRHTSGHVYFSLKDENAVVRCVMFRAAAQSLNFVPQDGKRAYWRGGICALYVRDGQYQLYVQSMQKEGEGEALSPLSFAQNKAGSHGVFQPRS